MTLLLTGDREQALLALVIKEARQVADAEDNYVGRTAIQKIMYFLKIRGIAMKYRFEIHHYGPFCQNIVTDLEWLTADNVIKDQSTNPGKYSNYAPDAAMEEILGVVSDLTEEERKIITDTTAELSRLKPKELELFATLDYLLREVTATGKKDDLKEAVIKRFVEVKKDKFTRDEIEPIYNVVARLASPQVN